jgi:uncharacterized membrane protein YdbT with pleckstrin-like domain
MVAVVLALLLSCACSTANRKSRFVFLTSTLQLALLPCYIGIYLALFSPVVICILILALGALWAFIRGSIYASFRMCGRSTDVRRRRLSRNQRVLAKKRAKACRKEIFALGRQYIRVRNIVLRLLAMLRFVAFLSVSYEMLLYAYWLLSFTYHLLAYF